ncbi:MAG: cytochrome c [Thermoanaerobaculia bacterium]
MRFLVGILFGVLLVVAGCAAVILTGSFNTAATVPPGKLEKQIAGFALDRSVAKRAPQRKNPFSATPEVLREGLGEYREHCLVCHAAPGVDAGEIGSGLNPAPPDLTIPKVQARSDGELFWLTSEGIRMTGMPAFGPTESEEDIWKIVAFMRHLPELTDEEQARLRQRGEEDAAPTSVEGAPPAVPTPPGAGESPQR